MATPEEESEMRSRYTKAFTVLAVTDLELARDQLVRHAARHQPEYFELACPQLVFVSRPRAHCQHFSGCARRQWGIPGGRGQHPADDLFVFCVFEQVADRTRVECGQDSPAV